MELDIRTLAFVATLSSFLMAVSLFSLWWTNRTENATFHWMAGAFLMALGFFLIGLRHLIGPMWSVVLANLAILTGYYLQYTGVCAFLRKPVNRYMSVPLFAVVGVGFVYFTFVSPDVSMRIMLISWAVALLTLLAAIRLGVEVMQRFSLPEALTAMFFTLYAVFMTARGAYSLFEKGVQDFMAAGTIHALSLLLIIVLSIVLSIGYSVMVSVRLNRLLVSEIEVKNRFFSIVAHDLKSPFTVLMGSTALFKKMAETTSRQKLVENAERLNVIATKVYGLVENLLDWSRLQLDQETVSPKSVSAIDIVNQGLAPLRHVAEAKTITIDVTVGPQKVYVDANMLATVLRNLIDNAIKFCEPGGHICITSQDMGDEVEIAVQDTGVGIDPEHRNKLFDIDTKTSTTGTSGEQGSGLGLPLCRDLVSKNHGELRIDETWTQGTRFIVRLPGLQP